VFSGYSAAGAAENVNMSFFIGTVKKTGDQIAFAGYRFFAHRTGTLDKFFCIWMTVWATKDMTNAVGLAGVDRRFDLFALGQERTANRANSRFTDFPPGSGHLALAFFGERRGKQPIGENQQSDPDKK